MGNTVRVADYIASTLKNQGCDTAFMVSGGMMMHLMDAVGRAGFRYYCNHHEQASAMGADGYARQSGKLGLCLATSGPGATNIVTGLAGAYQDSVPILFLTGQCKRRETVRGRGIPGLRQCGFLEVDIIPIVQSITKYAAFVDEPADIRFHLEKAIHLATTGRPGPVLLDIPLDVQGATVDPSALRPYQPEPETGRVDEAELMKVVAAIQRAQRPLILAGHGIRCAGMADQFRALVERWRVPVATTMMAKDLMPYDHPLFVGHPGPRSHRGANFAVQLSDVIVSMGCSLHIQNVGYEGDLFAPGALKIQLDLDPAVLAREHIGANWKYAWDIKQYLPLLEQHIAPWQPGAGDKWRRVTVGWKSEFSSDKEPHQLGAPSDPVNLYEFAHILSEELSGTETILTDAGQPHPVLGQAFRTKGEQRYLNPGSFAEMGYALPASFGAAVADPSRTIVSVFGDGSLQTNVHELQTLVAHQFNIKTFVINNGGYGSIRNTQKNFFAGHYVGSTADSGVTLPDTEKLCAAYGVPYVRCGHRGEVRETIRKVMAMKGPVLCEVVAQVEQRLLPVVPSMLMPDGSMRSKALHEMAPPVSATLDSLRAQLA